jgi:photosystem II stability/assembly factor-like uncharacterized protein
MVSRAGWTGTLALIGSLLATSTATPAGVDPALFQELRWRLIGPFRGGRVLAVAGVPGEREHFYFGSVNGGVWETIDAGRTWQPIFDGQPIGTIGAIALAPSDPKVIYVGTGEADMRSDIAQGDGMYKSADAGKTWTRIGLAGTQQIGRILVDPRDPSRVLVAALGHPYGPNAERGVFRSTDGGATWQKVLFKDENTGAIDLAFEPGDSRVLYAALWQTRRPPWSVYPPSNGPGSGLYKSADGGDTWRPLLCHGFPAKPGRIGLALSPSRPDRVYAMVDAPEGGLYRSDDRGPAGPARAPTGGSGAAGGTSAGSRSSRAIRTWSTPATPRSIARGTAGRPSSPSRERPAATTTTSCGSTPIIPSAACSGSTRAQLSRSTAAGRGAPGTTSPRARCTMSAPTAGSPTGCMAPSRTRARRGFPAAPPSSTASP